MKRVNLILILLLGVMTIPIFSIIVLSFQNNNGESLKWYREILHNENFSAAFLLSIVISVCTALLTALLSFIISLSWFNKKQMFPVLVLLLVTGLLPPDMMALSISKTAQFLGFNSSNLFFLIIGLTLYTLPFAVLMFWSRFYFIEDATIVAAKDIGVKKFYIITKIILPLSKATVISCMLLSFLLAFNEYPRTFYLSGPYVLVSEFLNGKLSSGANESIYAGGSITIIITVAIIISLSLYNAFITRKRQLGKAE